MLSHTRLPKPYTPCILGSVTLISDSPSRSNIPCSLIDKTHSHRDRWVLQICLYFLINLLEASLLGILSKKVFCQGLFRPASWSSSWTRGWFSRMLYCTLCQTSSYSVRCNLSWSPFLMLIVAWGIDEVHDHEPWVFQGPFWTGRGVPHWISYVTPWWDTTVPDPVYRRDPYVYMYVCFCLISSNGCPFPLPGYPGLGQGPPIRPLSL